jgi:type II secretory pathway component PulK
MTILFFKKRTARKDAVGKKRGSALIVVLSLIALISVLAASSVSLSQTSRFLTAFTSQKAFSSYAAEGAAARTQWLIMSDKRKYTDRSIGRTKLGQGEERYIADGISRFIDYYGTRVEVRISDMASGMDISTSGAASNIESMKTAFLNDADEEGFASFIDKFKDYIDDNDFTQQIGMEAEGYLSDGLYPLPRNGNMEFREEILLIPGASKFFRPDQFGRLSVFRIIPPKNMPKMPNSNNFFNASKEMIMALCAMSAVEADTVIKARDLWFENGQDLSETLDTGIFTLLKSKFSFNESGFYTISVNTSPDPDKAGKKLFVSLRISQQMSNPGNRYYEWISY